MVWKPLCEHQKKWNSCKVTHKVYGLLLNLYRAMSRLVLVNLLLGESIPYYHLHLMRIYCSCVYIYLNFVDFFYIPILFVVCCLVTIQNMNCNMHYMTEKWIRYI